jgi:hypothetical protein
VERPRDDGELVSARVRTPQGLETIEFATPGIPPSLGADAYLAATLLPAMRAGLALEVQGPVSPRLLRALPAIQDLFHYWSRRFRVVPVDASDVQPPESAGEEAACFFSGGVDSFFTALTQREEYSTLVFVDGIELGLQRAGLDEQVHGALREAAAELGKKLLVVRTTARAFSNRFVRWEWYHGAALAGVALALQRRFSRVYIPATNSFAHLAPWGSFPSLDPLWSTEAVEIVHDGAEVSRMAKLERVAESPTALRWLRVCWENQDGLYNCGRCEKCLRTMAALRLIGKLDEARTFPAGLDLELLASKRYYRNAIRYWLHELLARAEQQGDGEVARAARGALRKRRLWRVKEGVRRFLKGLPPNRTLTASGREARHSGSRVGPERAPGEG